MSDIGVKNEIGGEIGMSQMTGSVMRKDLERAYFYMKFLSPVNHI
jgi:hypothetical protein